jgi:hypothetical protein
MELEWIKETNHEIKQSWQRTIAYKADVLKWTQVPAVNPKINNRDGKL